MSWLVLIFISINLFSFVNLLDKFFCSKKFKNTYAFVLSVYFASFIFVFGLSFFVDWSNLSGWPFFWALASGPIYFLMWVLWWRALASGEVSRAAAIFNTAPIFNAFVAVVFLKEELTLLKWLAIFFIVTGAVLVSWENKTNGRFNQAYLLVVMAAMANAVGNVASKFATVQIDALALYPISFFSSLPFYLFLSTKKEIVFEVKIVFSHKRMLLILFLRSLIAFTAICLFYLSLAKGPVSLISAIYGIGPLLVFIYSTAISLFWPKFIKEELEPRVLFLKAVAIALVVIGIVLINQ